MSNYNYFFSAEDNQLKLRRPYEIRFSPEVLQKLLNRYNKNREQGGFLSGRISSFMNQNIITMEKISPIANVSPSPRWNYIPKFSQYIKVLSRLGQAFPKYIPFTYHNHPKASLLELLEYRNLDWKRIYNAVINQSPSPVDSQSLQVLRSKMGSFVIPNLLITKNLQGNFILFAFGAGTDYEDMTFPTIGKWTESKVEWIVNQIREKFLPQIKNQWESSFQSKLELGLASILSALLIAGVATVYPNFALNLILGTFIGFMNYDSLQQVTNPLLLETTTQEVRMQIKNY